MSSPRVLEACQEESISRAQWLEEELVGPSLGVVVGELLVMAGQSVAEQQFTAEQAAEWLGRDLHPALSAGLATLPKDKLDELFRRPAILSGLQELVLVEGSEHWDGLVGRSDVFKATAAFHRRQLAQRLGFADQADPPSTTGRILLPAAAPPTGRSRWLPAAVFALSGLAAAVLAAVMLPRLTRDPASSPPGAADHPGQLATAAPPPATDPQPSPDPPAPLPDIPSPMAIVRVQTQSPEPLNPTPPQVPPTVPVMPVPAPAPSATRVVVDPAGPPPGDPALHDAVVVPHHPWVASLAGPGPISEELLAVLAAESRTWSQTVAAAEQLSPSDLALAVEEAQRAATELFRVVGRPRGNHVLPPQREAIRRGCQHANEVFSKIDAAVRGVKPQRGDMDEQRRKLLEALDILERALAPPARDPA